MNDMRRDDNFSTRLDTQDDLLRQILAKMAEHRKEHEIVDPSIVELVGILKGVKFLKGFVILCASIVGSLWVAWLWAKDHIKW